MDTYSFFMCHIKHSSIKVIKDTRYEYKDDLIIKRFNNGNVEKYSPFSST